MPEIKALTRVVYVDDEGKLCDEGSVVAVDSTRPHPYQVHWDRQPLLDNDCWYSPHEIRPLDGGR